MFLKKQTEVRRHLPNNPCCRGELWPKVSFSCLLLGKVTSSSRALSPRHSSTCYYKTQQRANSDSGSSRESDTTARGARMRRSENIMAGSQHLISCRQLRAALFKDQRYQKAALRAIWHPPLKTKKWCCDEVQSVKYSSSYFIKIMIKKKHKQNFKNCHVSQNTKKLLKWS